MTEPDCLLTHPSCYLAVCLLVASCRMHSVKYSSGELQNLLNTQPFWPPGLGKARFCPLISTERVTRRQNFLAEKVWKQGLFFLPSWSPYGRLPTALHRMRAENCLRNKSSAFYCQTTNHLTHDLRPVFRVPRRPFHCQYVSLCTKGSEFCQRMLNQIYDCESVRIIWDLPGTCPNLKIRLLQWI